VSVCDWWDVAGEFLGVGAGMVGVMEINMGILSK